jgi:hypothetical protein
VYALVLSLLKFFATGAAYSRQAFAPNAKLTQVDFFTQAAEQAARFAIEALLV